MTSFDLVVIGGGSGGVRAARVAASHGARVALVEQYRLGGTCVIRGCVPKKLMVYASRFAQEFEEAAGYGWRVDGVGFDWATLKSNRDREVARLEAVYRSNLLAAGVTLFEGHATVQDARSVRLADGTRLQAGHVLLATGARPELGPDFPGRELAINSDGFFDLTELPRRVLVQGAGYIALELACVLRLLGAEVTLVLRGEQILRGFDNELREHLAAQLQASGLQIRPGTTLHALQRGTSGIQAHLGSSGSATALLEVDCVLQALGRVPNTEGLGLAQAGVQVKANGAIEVDAWSETSVKGVHAVGDVTNRVNLTPMAIREGHAYADTVFGALPRQVDHELVPTAVFTTPEVGVVGLTEEQALAKCPQLDVYRTSFRPMKATLSGHSGRMFLKLLVDRATDRVLGFHSVGPDTGEMAQLVGIALQMRATKRDFDATLAVHPTAAEELVTMRHPSTRHGM